MKDPARESLDARLAKLPPDIVPPRYLWPSIERQIERQPLRAKARLLQPLDMGAHGRPRSLFEVRQF